MGRKFFQEYFNFSVRERNGIIVLLIILSGLIIFNTLINYTDKSGRIDFSQFEDEIDRFMSKSKEKQETDIELFNFDPNTADREELELLGLNQNVINNIINFRNSGGRFFNKKDLQRIYSLNDEEYNRIKDYIVISKQDRRKRTARQDKKIEFELFEFDPNTIDKESLLKLGLNRRQANNLIRFRESGGNFNKPEDIVIIYGITEEVAQKLIPYIKIHEPTKGHEGREILKEVLKININKADISEIQKIRGIGPVFSERIVNYRDQLGGFYNKNQLLDVWGIDKDLLESISENIIIDKNYINKINLNTAEYIDLISHPYIDRRTTTTILEYKQFAGKIYSVKELIEQRVLEQEEYEKLKQYLSVE